MKRLIRLIFALALGLSVLIAAIIGLTHQDANRFAYLFTRPDGSRCQSACLLGVEPLTMTFKQADAILQKHPSLKQAHREFLDRTRTTLRYLTSDFYVLLNNVDGHSSMRIVFYTERVGQSPRIVFPDLLILMGVPYGTYIQPSGYAYDDCAYFEFRYKNSTYHIATTAHTKGDTNICPGLNQAIKGISFDDSELPDSMKMTRWLGFAPYKYYADEFETLTKK